LAANAIEIIEGGGVYAASVVVDTPITLDDGDLFGGIVRAPEISVENGSVLGSLDQDAEHLYALDLRVGGLVSIDATSRIDVSRCGYPSGHPGQLGPFGSAGASYGGLGGDSGRPDSQSNDVYGDHRYPEWGTGALGGGLVRIAADALHLDGQILADANRNYGGQSGGGIYVSVGELVGSGSMSAAGGNAEKYFPGAGGGGGRIAVYANNL